MINLLNSIRAIQILNRYLICNRLYSNDKTNWLRTECIIHNIIVYRSILRVVKSNFFLILASYVTRIE